MFALPTVLVIDDDPLVNRLIQRSLEGRSDVRQEFAVPEEGILDLDGIDLVFLDYQLPVRNGLEILEEIRDLRPDLPVIFLTGFGNPELAEKALKGGADVFLTKPVGPKRIVEVFERMLKPSAVAVGAGSGTEAPKEINGGAGPDRRFVARVGDQSPILGRVSRFGYRSAFVEFPRSCSVKEGDAFTNLRFRFGDQELYTGEGAIGGVIPSSPGTVEAEIRIQGGWRVDVLESARSMDEDSSPETAEASFSGDLLKQEWDLLEPEYRLAVHDLADVLSSVHRESTIYTAGREEDADPTVESMEKDSEFVAKTAESYGNVFWSAVERFERAAISIVDSDLQMAAKEFARRILFPYTLSSPFLSRVVERPIGVPGDYGMLGQILGNPLEGYTIYDRIVNSWILSCGAASAYRFRVNLLYREIVRTVKECREAGRKAKILSMASGVAYEIQRYIQEPVEEGEVDFTMVDFSTVTLEEAERQYAALGSYPKGIFVHMAQSSVIDLANQSRGLETGRQGEGFQPADDHDLVYCAGLFDYLSDRLIRKVILYLFGRLRPGGRLVISNFTVRNPIRSWMTYVMDWNLIYRSEEAFEKLVREAIPEASLSMETDADGVEVYAIASKL